MAYIKTQPGMAIHVYGWLYAAPEFLQAGETHQNLRGTSAGTHMQELSQSCKICTPT